MFERASAMRFDMAAALAAVLLWPAAIAAASEPYVVAEALFLQRDNESTPRTLVMNSDTNQPAIGTADLRFPVAGGVRLFVGHHGEDRHGWELGYLGVYGMVADAAVAGSGNLEIAPDLANQVASLRGASLAGCSYGSALNGCEANLLATSDYVHHARDNAYRADGIPHTATVDWIAGFRWAGLEENATIGLATPGLGVSGYGVRATSNLFGGQLGVRGRIDWERWGLEGWAKAALAGAALSQSQTPIIDAVIDRQYRSERGARAGDVGGIFDWSVTAVRHLNDTWSIRAGYTMIWLTGVALAPDQFDFTVDTTAGTSVVGEKTVWLQGGSLGLEARW